MDRQRGPEAVQCGLSQRNHPMIRSFHPLLFLLAGLASLSALEFRHGDRVCLIGNSTAERMQRHGWLETLLQARYPERSLVFRNLGFPGDEVDSRPRSKGFTAPEEYLAHCRADTILVFFGANEAWKGEEGLAGFKAGLEGMVDSYRRLRPNGRSAPALALFSPLAHEDTGDRNLPDGSARNPMLERYGEAVREVARSRSAQFVDLFAISRKLYEETEEPLTLNGIHLTETGNRLVAEAIASALAGSRLSFGPEHEPLRQAVLDKNWHWFNRYRATDGNDVWGGRSGLKFVDGQTNFEVLQHELRMLDIMAANRDRRIWALARGTDIEVDDSNVPGPVPVVSNVGGGSRSSNPDKEGSLQYISGEEGVDRLAVPDGFAVNLFADERMFPELVNPVQMAVDTRGRLWVATWPTYPKWEPLKEMDDRLLILPDENRDGIADRAITFAKVHNPSAIEFWNGGVLVASQPDILFLKDTDGDDVADVRIALLNGIGSADTHHAANAFTYGPDGGIYWQSGIFLVNTIESPWAAPLSTGASGMYRFDPRRYTIDFHAANSPNPHGISFDYWGYHYANDGTSGQAKQVYPHETGFRMRNLLDREVRPVPANGIVSSSQFPESMQGDFLILNTIGFLGIKQYALDRNPHTGVVWGEPKGDLMVSSDRNFRPTDMEFGEDGALYVADWQNVIIGHMQHNIRDPNRDHRHGRIYRMVAEGRPLQEPVAIDGEPIGKLLDNLKHPVDGVRYRTRIELSERPTGEVIRELEKWTVQFDPGSRKDAHHLLEALWLHQQHNVRNPQLLAALLKSPEPHARRAAGTVQHFWYNVPTTRASIELASLEEEPVEQASGVVGEADGRVQIRIGTVVEQMRYDVPEFEVEAGSPLRVAFSNPDYMPHNIVFTAPGAADEVALAAIALGSAGFDADWLPESDKILAASSLVDHAQQEALEFDAPQEPGDYPYVCTFPGHHVLMRGVMKVR